MHEIQFTALYVDFCAITFNKSWGKLTVVFSFSHPDHPWRSGENDVEYSSTMELEDGDLMEDAAAAATPGASGMKNDSRIPIKAKRCWIPFPAPLGSNTKLRVLQAVLFWELLHHVVCTDYCSVAETLHWFDKKKGGGIIWRFKNDVKVWRAALCLWNSLCSDQ